MERVGSFHHYTVTEDGFKEIGKDVFRVIWDDLPPTSQASSGSSQGLSTQAYYLIYEPHGPLSSHGEFVPSVLRSVTSICIPENFAVALPLLTIKRLCTFSGGNHVMVLRFSLLLPSLAL